MIRSYPDADTSSHSTGPRKHRTKGAVRYTCKLCTAPEWYSPYKANATRHIENEHYSTLPTTLDTSFQQRTITSLFQTTLSSDTLRAVFNRKAYQEAIIGLLTVRRIPFSTVEWSELR
jgi:hypothetical protein